MPKMTREQAAQALAGKSSFIKFDKEKTKFRVVSEAYISYRHKLKDANDKFINVACPNFDGNVFVIKKGRCPICDQLNDPTKNIPQNQYDDESATRTIFYAILNRDTNQIQILDKWSVAKVIIEHDQNDDWGDPTQYDFTVTKKGSGMRTKYTTVASPKKSPLTEEELDMFAGSGVDLEKMTTPGTYAEIMARLNGDSYEAADQNDSDNEVDIDEIDV